MGGYNPKVKVYYIKSSESPTESNRLVPAPKLTISPEYYYANNVVVGYTYNITINGFATSIDLRTYDGSFAPGFSDVVGAIKNVKNIFNNNGGKLLVVGDGGQEIFSASGAIVKSLNFDESDNRWYNYAPYTVELEVNDIIVKNCSGSGSVINCQTIPSGITVNPEFIDIQKYRIKSFSDNWSFNLNENIYNSYEFTSPELASFSNEYFDVSYTINATGKNYFVNNKVLPAWEQAKNFCQYRLYSQIHKLINNALPISSDDNGCNGIALLSNIHTYSNNSKYLLDGLNANEYKIFNEKIRCETSESEGSFSLVYSAILKRTQTANNQYLDSKSIHTFNLNKSIQDDGKTKNITINVDGTIQGLIEGGLTATEGVFELPQNGEILLSNQSPDTDKYSNALSSFNQIRNGNKLKDNFAKLLGVSYSSLGIKNQPCKNDDDVPKNNSLNITHNYNEGTISYTVSYDSNKNCENNDQYTNISISIEDSVPQIAEFVIPGRAAGPIIQNIRCDTPKKYTINIDGAKKSDDCCPTIDSLLNTNCDQTPPFMTGIPPIQVPRSIITTDKQTYSTDGSFSLTRSYIVYDIP
jgi:hypothetical protein